MRFVEVKRADIGKIYRPGKVQKILEEFIDSGLDTVEVLYTDGEYKDVYVCTGTLRVTIKKMHLSDTLEAMTINKKCYLCRKDGMND